MATTQPSLTAIQATVETIRQELTARFVERSREIDALFAAAISRQHIVLLGDAGEAKSAVTEAFTARITGATYFKTQIFAQTTADEIDGPFDILALEQGHLRRLTATYMPDAHIAYLDEIWNGGPALLNSLLLKLNEREFRNDGAIHPICLEFCVGSSNRMPQGDDRGQDLRALQDRFALWLKISTLSDGAHRQFMTDELARRKQRAAGQNVTGRVGTTLSLDALHQLQQAALLVDIPADVLDGWYQIRDELVKQSYPRPSTRRSGWLLDLVCAHTILRGRTTATLDDLAVLQHALWQRPDDARSVAGIVLGVANPLLAKAYEVLDLIQSVAEECIVFYGNPSHAKAEKHKKLIESRESVTAMGKQLVGLRDQAKGAGRDAAEIEAMLGEARARHAAVTRLEERGPNW